MGYVGTAPLSGDYRKLDDISGSFNGSTTDFTLQVGSVNVTPPKETTLLISVGGILQEPVSAYTVSGSTLSFTAAPVADSDFFGVMLGDTMDIGTPSDATVTGAKLATTVLTGLSASTTVADADLLLIDDGAGGTLRKMTRANFIESAALDAINIDGGAIDGVTLGTNSAVTQAVIDNININGTTIGHTSDTDLLTLTSANLAVAGDIEVSGSVEVATIDYTDGDNSMTIADGGKVTFSAGFAVGSDAAGDILYHNGTSYIRLAKGAADTVLTMNDAANAPGWEAAAGGGDSHDFVADGAISDGDAVALTSAGKVKSVVSEINNDPVTFETGATRYHHTVYDTSNDKVVVVFRDDDDSDYGKAVVGTVASSSGHPITFGSAVTYEAAGATYNAICFDSNAEKVVIAYRDVGNSNYGTAIVGTVSGTSISFGTPAVFESAAIQLISVAFDPDNNKVGIFFQDVGNGGAGTGIVGTVSGTDISFGSATVFDTANSYIWNHGATYDTTANKFVVAYQDDGAATGQCVVATISGTSISFGTVATFLSGNRAFDIAAEYDATANKTVIAYRDANNGDYGTAIVGTVSGTDITFGSSAVFHAFDVNSESINATYVPNRSKVIITYDSNSAAISPAQSRGEYVFTTITGTTPSFSDPLVFTTASCNYTSPVYDPDQGVVVVAYEDDEDGDQAKAVVIDTAVTTNYTNFIGFASAAISDTATGTIDILGTVNESQSSLTVGSRYYMNNFAALTTTSIANREVGLALSATKMLVTGNNLS